MDTRVLEVIAQLFNDGSAVTVVQLARKLCISERRLQILFKSCTGVSIRSFLASYRLHTASDALIRCGSVKQVQLELGWRDASSFTRQFKGHFRHSPSEYVRRSQRGGQGHPKVCAIGGQCPWIRVQATVIALKSVFDSIPTDCEVIDAVNITEEDRQG